MFFCKENKGKKDEGCCGEDGRFCCLGKIALKALLALLLFGLVVYVYTLVRGNLKQYHYIGKAATQQNTIAISGEGKVTATPNIAMTEIGLLTEKKDVASAQKENTEKMNKLIAAVKAAGVEEKDIQTTQYQIYPKYDYSNGKSNITGYNVSQSVTVKIRDLAKISAVLAKVGEAGANQVSNLTFTIDEPESLRVQAREKALENAKEKAEALAKMLGVKILRVASFNEYNQAEPMPLYARSAEAYGIGGGAPAPDIQTGTLDVKVGVNVIYEID